MIKSFHTDTIRLDLNNPVFQKNLFNLQKPDRNSALNTLKKLSTMTWSALYSDNGLKWKKIVSVKPPEGTSAIYSLRITQSRRATGYRNGNFLRFLTIAPDHDAIPKPLQELVLV